MITHYGASSLDQSGNVYIFDHNKKINVSNDLEETSVWERLEAGRYDYRCIIRIAEWLAENALNERVKQNAENAVISWNKDGEGALYDAFIKLKKHYQTLGQYPGSAILVDIWLRDGDVGVEPISPSQCEYYLREQIFRSLIDQGQTTSLASRIDDLLCAGPLAVIDLRRLAIIYASTNLSLDEIEEIKRGDTVSCWMYTGAFDVIFFG